MNKKKLGRNVTMDFFVDVFLRTWLYCDCLGIYWRRVYFLNVFRFLTSTIEDTLALPTCELCSIVLERI